MARFLAIFALLLVSASASNLRSAPKPHFNPLRLMEGEGEIQGEGAQNDVYERIGDVDEVVDDEEAEQGAPIDEDNKAVTKTTKAIDAPEKDNTAGFDLKNTHPLDASKPDGHGVFNRITGRVDDSFVQSLIQVGDVDDSTNEHGDTDGEAPADYVAPVVAEEEDDSEDAEEKVDDDSEEGVADEESEEVSGPTGGAFLQKDVDDSKSDDESDVEDSSDGGAVPEDDENVDAAHDDKEAGAGDEEAPEQEGEESFLQVASKGSDDYSDADDEEDESNDSTELSAALKDGTDDIEQGFDLDEDDAAVIADDESEEDVEALESEEEDSADEDQ